MLFSFFCFFLGIFFILFFVDFTFRVNLDI